MLLERRHRPPVALVGHVRLPGVEGALRRDRGGQRRRLGRRDPCGQVVDRADAVVVAARRDVRDQDEPLPPVVEHHRAVDHQQADRRARRVVRLGRRVSVEEGRRLVREVAHQAADQGREVGEPRAGERARDRDQRLPRVGVGGQGHRRERPHDVLDPHAVAVDHDGRGGVARHERVPSPPLRALDGLQDQAGAVARHGGEQPDGRGDVGQQLRPHGDQRPLGRERVELVTTGPHLQMRFHVRSFWSIPSDPCADRRRGNGGTPDRPARGCGGSRCERGTYGRAGMRLREPRRHVQVIPCIRIRRRLCLLSDGGVNDCGRSGARYPVEPMRLSRPFVPTLREDPADAEIASHRLLLRGGFVRQVMSGVYTSLPLGLRTMRKIETVVREEMDAAGSIELRMPIVLPADPWSATGRYDLYGDTLFKLTDRHDRDLILGPTQEEVVALMAAADLPSYRDLPKNVYQVEWKYRDEFRPRFGLLRVPRVPDEGRVLDRPRRGRHARVVPDHVRGVRADLRSLRARHARSSRPTRDRSAAA